MWIKDFVVGSDQVLLVDRNVDFAGNECINRVHKDVWKSEKRDLDADDTENPYDLDGPTWRPWLRAMAHEEEDAAECLVVLARHLDAVKILFSEIVLKSSQYPKIDLESLVLFFTCKQSREDTNLKIKKEQDIQKAFDKSTKSSRPLHSPRASTPKQTPRSTT